MLDGSRLSKMNLSTPSREMQDFVFCYAGIEYLSMGVSWMPEFRPLYRKEEEKLFRILKMTEVDTLTNMVFVGHVT